MATPRKSAAKTKSAKPPSAKTRQTKQQRLIAMLRRPGGATIAQLGKAFRWQSHTVRGAISGALKKKLGLKIVSQKPEEGDRVYQIDLAGDARDL